ncbi:FAD-binding and (Fe-S)-binding domain-containing protein [Compostimonas suwonensis]|uniref:D-lactate dehydrogenase (cytochrome) n=1 Tax=Compostimonas suwonensis TaxID=1048394 RepID=A0A2M9BCX0_9MICO|nr:FAD-binding and (Fe-S)-binding domain-containing protein [Compostimonas suwonensis]PJJ55801.1 D-lactate dehydrogenase [Compostimonas suwonensis]
MTKRSAPRLVDALGAPGARLDHALLGEGVTVSQRAIDRLAMAHDASHYLLVPEVVLTPRDAHDVARIFRASHASGRPVTFRSGGTSLSGQGVSSGILVDTRKNFRSVRVLDGGARARVQPGATVRITNAHLARHGRKLGPDPASEIACTIGGVIANNSSGMACGIEQNSYRTVESLVLVLPSGTVVDTAHPDADRLLLEREPELHRGLAELRRRVIASDAAVARIRAQFSMKNTMGYGLNSLLDFDSPVQMLAHLAIGSEGTLAFVAEATFRTVEVLPCVSTGLLVFPTLNDATAALPALVDAGLATIELMDAQSLRVARSQPDAPEPLAALDVTGHAALLIEFHAADDEALARAQERCAELFAALPLSTPLALTTDPVERAALWHVRKGLYTTVAGARPSGTTALLEDVVVPVERLLHTCERLIELFEQHGYEGSVIFGHAKDGNIHFMLNERFDEPGRLDRYERFTEDMVELVLAQGGSLKAEHGTGRIMAPFVRRQYGDELYEAMLEIKRLCDPTGLLNPGVVLSDEPRSYLQNLKTVPTVEAEVDRCVECGYCEPTCPSKNLTLTPRQRIVVRREMRTAEAAGDTALLAELTADYGYDGVDTCAVDGLCAVACPVGINTGDLVRRLRVQSSGAVEGAVWEAAAKTWNPVTRIGGLALTVAKAVPAPLVTGVTRVGRALLGDETVPLYDAALPGGGSARPRGTRPRRRDTASDAAARPDSPAAVSPADAADAVFFAACIGTMFGPEGSSLGAAEAFRRLCERAGITLAIPESPGSLCCGTPWKSKGHLGGYRHMSETVLPSLVAASGSGRLPIVCDAASCTEGLETMHSLAVAAGGGDELRFVDSVQFVQERILPRLAVTRPLGSIAVHHSCSTTTLGANPAMDEIARFVADDVHLPVDWGCCAFAGDRGLLHPELTASATATEAAELGEREFDAYVSANRTCELGMTRATARPYRHILEVLEEATRPL